MMYSTQYMFKTAGLLPTNFMEWGTSIILELVERLPDIQSYIKDYRTVMQDNKGKGFGLVVLQGNKAFIPVFIEEWKTKPMDVMIYKSNNEIKFKYLSKRSLIDLLITSGLDTNVANPSGAKDNMINVFSPVGEYHTSGNPYYGLTAGSKAASEFVYNLINDFGMMKYANENIINYYIQKPEIVAPKPSYYLLHKQGSDYVMYTPNVAEEGTIISAKELHNLLPNDNQARTKIASTLEYGELALLGTFKPREGNVLVDLDKTDAERVSKGTCDIIHPGMYYYGGNIWYINPNTVNLDQFQSDLQLAVTQGKYTMKHKFEGAQPKNTQTAILSEYDLIPEAKTIDIGKMYSVLNEKQGTITVPFKVLSKTITEDNRITITVKPIAGEVEPQTIFFYGGEVVRKIKDNFYAYPILYSRLVHIPEEYQEYEGCYNENDLPNFIPVSMYYGGENMYTFVENSNDIKGPFDKGKTVFEMINRYRMSLEQATALLHKLPFVNKITFRFKPVAMPVSRKGVNDLMPLHQKQALGNIVKLASQVAELFDRNPVLNKTASVEPLVFAMMQKLGGPEVSNPTTTDASQRADANQMNILGGAANAGGNQQLMSGLMQINSIDKPLRDVIDKIMFYYSGSLRKDQGVELLSSLEKSFLEIESKLGLAIMLTQIEQLPGQSYDELRTLLADVDSFLTSLRGSQVLIRNV